MDETKKELLNLVEKGNRKLYTILRHVSNSGMFRLISVFTIVDNKPVILDWYIDNLGLYKRDGKREGLRISGCGMDMGFDVVYNLGRFLFPNGDGKTVTGRNGDKKPETDGGYLLNQKWI